MLQLEPLRPFACRDRTTTLASFVCGSIVRYRRAHRMNEVTRVAELVVSRRIAGGVRVQAGVALALGLVALGCSSPRNDPLAAPATDAGQGGSTPVHVDAPVGAGDA